MALGSVSFCQSHGFVQKRVKTPGSRSIPPASQIRHLNTLWGFPDGVLKQLLERTQDQPTPAFGPAKMHVGQYIVFTALARCVFAEAPVLQILAMKQTMDMFWQRCAAAMLVV